ncbi:MAG: UDP-N-acetylmuramoylalanyl-D-glutamate-2,6-diaminopimelate ligase [uncultured bacterium]|nr:MAG: UDP-N-acetylmuramoylalanyl-D-glutamate-2,6-diaminopimelate ligase [uncultured bacterium]
MFQKVKNIYHLINAILVNIIFFFPGRKMFVIGVTGTDGKTTTANLIYHILRENRISSSMLTSIGANVGDKKYETGFHVTTPTPFYLQSILKKAVRAKSKYFVMEVTSHALDQHRDWGVPFKIGVLTNITSEHLDYHKTYDNYLKTKEKLLIKADVAIVNRDDGSYTMLSDAKNTKSSKNWITYGMSETADVNPANFKIESRVLLGDFSKLNALAAVSCARLLGITDAQIKDAIKTFRMPLGRLDFVYDGKFAVVIDFAHTPNAFEQLLSALRQEIKGRLIHVFGSAGERDHAKRPFMGETSSKYSDILILTAEDPRSEDVNKIIEEIHGGIKKKDAKVFTMPDRREAINAAIEMAGEGDLVLITGKSHEKTMNFGKEELPWDEYAVIKNALDTRK